MRTNKLLIFSVVVMSLVFVTCSRFLTCSNEEVKKEEPKEILSKDKTISKVALNTNPKVTATVDGITKKITATVPFDTDLTKIILAITHSGVSIFPLPKTPQDFSNGKTIKYTVKAEDGSEQEYTVSISVAKKLSNTKTITKASIISPKTEMNIDGITKKITATLPFGTDLTAITLNIEHSGASIAPLSSEAQDFSNGKTIKYTVKAEDGSEQEYTVSIGVEETILQSASISTFMGENGSDITISLKPEGDYKLYISNDANCDINNYKNCANAEMIEINGDSKTFNSKTLTIATGKTTYFIVQDSKGSYKITEKSNVFSPREGHQVIVFNNKMLLIGGRSALVNYRNDVYSSSNGAIWIQETANASFSARYSHQVVVFNNKMYLIGGYSGTRNYGATKNDVYSSINGKTWTLETANASFSNRSGHQVVVFDNKMFLIGGYSGTRNSGVSKNDVYSSIDGKVWNLETAASSFSARQSHQVVVYKGKMYLIGGYGSGGGIKQNIYNDVYSSIDGKTWILEKANASFSPRSGHKVVVFDNKMFLIGGLDNSFNYKNDVYSSSDGKTWNLETAAPSFSARYSHHVVVFNNKMYLTGGASRSPLRKKDIWRSSDGINWKEAFGITITK